MDAFIESIVPTLLFAFVGAGCVAIHANRRGSAGHAHPTRAHYACPWVEGVPSQCRLFQALSPLAHSPPMPPPGLLLSSATVALLMYTAGQLRLCYPLGMLSSLTFGSLISAIDPVSVLATFQVQLEPRRCRASRDTAPHLQALMLAIRSTAHLPPPHPQKSLGVRVPIFSMVFGESVLNNAAAMVLTNTLLQFTTTPFTPAALLLAAGSFLGVFSVAAAIGVGAGLASALLFKRLEVQHYGEVYMEVALSFTFPWAAFFLAEALRVSGVVAILFCGIVVRGEQEQSNITPSNSLCSLSLSTSFLPTLPLSLLAAFRQSLPPFPPPSASPTLAPRSRSRSSSIFSSPPLFPPSLPSPPLFYRFASSSSCCTPNPVLSRALLHPLRRSPRLPD